MENSANKENTKQQLQDNEHPKIETVTPDNENVHPLSRQGSKEELKTSAEPSADNSEPAAKEEKKQETTTEADEQENDADAAQPNQDEDNDQATDDPGAAIETVSP